MAMSYGKRKQPGTYHTNKPAGGNFDEGQLDGFGNSKGVRRAGPGLANDNGLGGGKFIDTFNVKKGGDTRSNHGARNKRTLRNDDGLGGGKFVDTENDVSGSGFGSGLQKPLAGDGRSGTRAKRG